MTANNIAYICTPGDSATFNFKGNPNSKYVLTCGCTWLEPFAPELGYCTALSITVTTDQNGNYPLKVTVLINDRCPPNNTPSGCCEITATPVGGGQGCTATVCIGCESMSGSAGAFPDINCTVTMPVSSSSYYNGIPLSGCWSANNLWSSSGSANGGYGSVYTLPATVTLTGTLTFYNLDYGGTGCSGWQGTVQGNFNWTNDRYSNGGPSGVYNIPTSGSSYIQSLISIFQQCNTTCNSNAQWIVGVAGSPTYADNGEWSCAEYNSSGTQTCYTQGYWASLVNTFQSYINSSGSYQVPDISGLSLPPYQGGWPPQQCFPRNTTCGAPPNATITAVLA